MADVSAKSRIQIKATLKEVHHLTISSAVRFDELKRDIQHRFPLLAAQDVDVGITYQDEDGDTVAIASEDDWRDVRTSVASGRLKLNIGATPYTRRKQSFTESQKSGFSVNAYMLKNLHLTNTKSSGTQVKDRNSSDLDEPPHQTSSLVMQANDYVLTYSQDQSDISPPTTARPTMESCGRPHFTFSSNGNSQSSDDDEGYGWPPVTGDTLDTVKIKWKRMADNVDSRIQGQISSYPFQKKGRVLIFNNQKFVSEPNIEGDFDTTCLSILFRDNLKYDVKSYSNQTVEQMRQKLDQEKVFLKKNDYSCYLLFILTHCDEHNLSGTHGGTIPLWEITGRLKDEAILQGKPKLVFIDGVRHEYQQREHGRPYDRPKMMSQMSAIPGPIKQPVPVCMDKQYHSIDSTDSCLANNMDDFYVYMAGTLGEGMPTYKGSLMMQALIRTFCDNLHQDSLKVMISKAERLMDEACTKTEQFQMPKVCTDSLKKDVYFTVNS